MTIFLRHFIFSLYLVLSSSLWCNLSDEEQLFNNQEIKCTLKDLGTLSLFDNASLKGFNENGQALIYARLEQNERLKKDPYVWMFWDHQLGLMTIDGRPSDGWEDQWLCINNNGLVVGIRQRPAPKLKNTFYYDLITWSFEEGYKVYQSETLNKVKIENTSFVAQCRNSNLVIVNRIDDYKENSQILQLEDGKLTDLTPSLKEQAKVLGFDAGGWMVFEVNSRGMLLGLFHEQAKHPYKDKKLEKSIHYFMKDGDKFYLVDWPEGFQPHFNESNPLWNGGGDKFSFDSDGQILFSYWDHRKKDSLIWDPETGLKTLEKKSLIEFLSENEEVFPPHGIYLLDDGTTVWSIFYKSWIQEQTGRGYIFEKNDQFWLLPTDSEGILIFHNSCDYPGLKIQKQSYQPLFQKKSGFIQVEVHGESHPFLIKFS